MGVLEITALKLKPTITPTDPSFLSSLRKVRDLLGTRSRFFVEENRLRNHLTLPHHVNPADFNPPANVFIFGFWESLPAHNAFLCSKEKDAILGPQEEQTELVWSVHLGDVDSMEACFPSPDYPNDKSGLMTMGKFIVENKEAGWAMDKSEVKSYVSKRRVDGGVNDEKEVWILDFSLGPVSEEFNHAVDIWQLRDLEKFYESVHGGPE